MEMLGYLLPPSRKGKLESIALPLPPGACSFTSLHREGLAICSIPFCRTPRIRFVRAWSIRFIRIWHRPRRRPRTRWLWYNWLRCWSAEITFCYRRSIHPSAFRTFPTFIHAFLHILLFTISLIFPIDVMG